MFDPAQPANGTPLSSAVMRAQLTSLKTLIDAVPAITSAVVDQVETLPHGEPATVTVSVVDGVLHLSFGIPQGPDGAEGAPGEVTAQQLADAVDARAHAIPMVDTLGITAEGEYSPAQIQEIVTKLDELITALKGN